MIATIKLKQLRFYAHHGVTLEEQKIGGDYIIDITITADINEQSFKYDQLKGTIDYSEIYAITKKEMNISSKLLEHVAYRIKQALINRFNNINTASVSITKLNPPIQADCEGATIEL